MSLAESKASTAAGGHGSMPPQLRKWALTGAGAAKIRWGEGGDYNRCVVTFEQVAAKHPDSGLTERKIHGMCGNLHEQALGISTAEHAKLLRAGDHHGSAARVKVHRVR